MILVRANAEHLIKENIDAWKYEYDFKDIALSAVSLSGRYPRKRTALNNVADITYLIFEGSAEFSVNNVKTTVFKGDIFVVPKGTHFSVSAYLCETVKMWMLDYKNDGTKIQEEALPPEESKFFHSNQTT